MTLLMRDQENIERGIKQGLEQGIEQGKLHILFSLVKDGILPLDEASKRAGLSKAEFSEKMEAMQ